ncbi:hypothetical protein BJY01DRAFT_253301 [Aspergillus pseudoustus]|uniref:Zn(2)-C6 fungal-type domain-containing protein n=1 Tax=Aspergillus pseudoustus TaxID=1810923 RepID=A0ABR4J1P1_9EURO
MPRNACTECRKRKVRCSVAETGSKCKRCQTRSLECSYVHRVNSLGHGTPTEPIRQDPASSELDADIHWGLQLSSSNSGLDIGTGTASELLREGELTQTLLLLYFQNFNDIHFMFDQTIFMRRFVLGDIPKVLLFAIMALGIRYSHAPFQNPHLRPHWGEPLYHQARHLLKEDFDHPSLTAIQVHVLLATYNLTFGGARKAWIFLSFARSFVSILKLDKPASDMDPVQAELCRRLIATIILMENTFPPCLNLERSLPPVSPLPQLYCEDQFDLIKSSAFANPNHTSSPCVTQEILILSEIYYEMCQHFRVSDTERLDALKQRLSDWQTNLPPSLAFNQANLETHQQKFTLRPFTYMHLLFTHIWQLALFGTMDWSASVLCRSSNPNKALSIYEHASATANIIQQVWYFAQIDIHNACFGQIIKTAQVVLTHHLLCTTDVRAMTATQAQLFQLRDCFIRVKAHCRLYNWVFDQAEWFLRIVNQPNFSQDAQEWQSMLQLQVMSLGTSYERMDYDTAGRSSGLEGLANPESLEQHRKNQIPTILTPGYIAQRQADRMELRRYLV